MSNLINKKNISAFAPATVANVGCGFDIFGFAVDAPGDEVSLSIKDKPGVRITKISGDQGRLPLEAEKNTASVSLQAMLNNINADFGVDMELHKKMDIGSGMGSSAASSVVSVFALNAMLKNPFKPLELLPFAIEGEKLTSGHSVHLDNIAACLLGGFVLVRSNDPIDVIKIPIPDDLYCTIIHPHIEIRTELSRKMLKTNLPLYKAVRQWGNIAGTLTALFTHDYELLRRSFEDEIVVPERAVLIPQYYEMRVAALENEAIGFSISGSGPSVFALSDNLHKAKKIAAGLQRVLTDVEIDNDVYISGVNMQGPRIIEQGSK